MHSHFSLQQSRLSNSPAVEQLISTADEAVGKKESRGDKGHTGDLIMRDKNKTPDREVAVERPMRHATTGYITYALEMISLGMIIDFPVDMQIGISVVWV